MEAIHSRPQAPFEEIETHQNNACRLLTGVKSATHSALEIVYALVGKSKKRI